jgi:hypothetical protein
MYHYDAADGKIPDEKERNILPVARIRQAFPCLTQRVEFRIMLAELLLGPHYTFR